MSGCFLKSICVCENYVSIQTYFMYAFGYFYSVILGGILVWRILEKQYEHIKKEKKLNDEEDIAYKTYPRVVGFIERLMYTTSFLLGRFEFVAVWLGFKVASRWEAAKLEKGDKKEINKYADYQTFLIGNALSLIYATTGWGIICFCEKRNDYITAAILGVGIILGTVILKIWWAKKNSSQDITGQLCAQYVTKGLKGKNYSEKGKDAEKNLPNAKTKDIIKVVCIILALLFGLFLLTYCKAMVGCG